MSIARILAVSVLAVSSQVLATVIPAEKDHVTSLDGNWRFHLEQSPKESKGGMGKPDPILTPKTFDAFYKSDYSENSDWHDLAVPGNWEIAGYSPATYNNPDNAIGQYRKEFEVPADWKGRQVLLNFDGVQNGCEVWCNGQPVKVSEPAWGRENYHEGGWTPFQVDLTPAVKFGEKNLLALRVTKNTKSSDLNSGDYFFLGGVHRPVTMFAVPEMHVENVKVETKLLPSDQAEVKVIVEKAGPDGTSADVSIDGATVASKGMTDGPGTSTITLVLDHPKLWSAEHPNLYNLKVMLNSSSGPVETIEKKIGVREITIDKGIVKVNGVPVKFVGVCRHDVWPEKGTAVDADVWRKDITLLKQANFNAIRTSHYPYGSGFYDLCDEMGMYVMDEFPYCWCNTSDKSLEPAFLWMASETMHRDWNHPSVMVWAIGNENRFGPNIVAVADLVKKLDKTRPSLASCLEGDKTHTDFDDCHYPKPSELEKFNSQTERRIKYPKITLENPNVWDVRNGSDWGSLDLWAEVYDRTMKVIYAGQYLPGNFLWEWQDRAVADKNPTKYYDYYPKTGINILKVKGIVDGWRNPRPDYYHLKVINAQIKFDPKIDREGNKITLNATNMFSFTDMKELTTTVSAWKDGKEVSSSNQQFELAPLSSGKISVDAPADADALRIDVAYANGQNIITQQFPLVEKPVVAPIDASNLNGIMFPQLNLVAYENSRNRNGWRLAVRRDATLANVKVNDNATSELAQMPLENVREMTADIMLADKKTNKVKKVGDVKVEFSSGNFSYHINWNGPKEDIEQLGWIFTMPKAFDHFSWDRAAKWSWYPEKHIGRPHGTATPDSANVDITKITRQDAFDFNSSKYNCNYALLTDSNGKGIAVAFDPTGRHQVRGDFAKNGYELVVNKQASPPMDIASNVVPDLYLKLNKGESVDGKFMVGSAK